MTSELLDWREYYKWNVKKQKKKKKKERKIMDFSIVFVKGSVEIE